MPTLFCTLCSLPNTDPSSVLIAYANKRGQRESCQTSSCPSDQRGMVGPAPWVSCKTQDVEHKITGFCPSIIMKLTKLYVYVHKWPAILMASEFCLPATYLRTRYLLCWLYGCTLICRCSFCCCCSNYSISSPLLLFSTCVVLDGGISHHLQEHLLVNKSHTCCCFKFYQGLARWMKYGWYIREDTGVHFFPICHFNRDRSVFCQIPYFFISISLEVLLTEIFLVLYFSVQLVLIFICCIF